MGKEENKERKKKKKKRIKRKVVMQKARWRKLFQQSGVP